MSAGVYVARDAAGVALYVGSTGNRKKRLAAHASSTPWWAQVAAIEWHPTPSRTLAYHRERELIAVLRPKFNRMSKGGAKAKSRDLGPVIRPRPEAFANLIEAFGSAAALAREVGCDHQTLSDVWRGVHYPSSKVIARLIALTGVPFDELFYVEVPDTPREVWLVGGKRKERAA